MLILRGCSGGQESSEQHANLRRQPGGICLSVQSHGQPLTRALGREEGLAEGARGRRAVGRDAQPVRADSHHMF